MPLWQMQSRSREGVCLNAKYKNVSCGDSGRGNPSCLSSGHGHTTEWRCGRDWAADYAQFLAQRQQNDGSFSSWDGTLGVV